MRCSVIVALVMCFVLSACGAPPTPTPEPAATPLPTAVPTATPAPTRTPVPTPTLVPTPTTILYVVQAGDVLGTIAQKFGTTVEAIVAANGITDADYIRIGQELVIPAPLATAAATQAP